MTRADGRGWGFFDPIVTANGTYCFKHRALCDRWWSLGRTVWAGIRVRTRHVGPVPIGGETAASIAAAAHRDTTCTCPRSRKAGDIRHVLARTHVWQPHTSIPGDSTGVARNLDNDAAYLPSPA